MSVTQTIVYDTSGLVIDAPTALTLTPPTTDISVELVGRWFGERWWNLLGDSTASAGGSEVLFAILQALNTVIFSCIILVLLYTVGAGLVGSAQEGQTMGKKYDTFWTSIRSVFSFVALAPLPLAKGLCMMQVMVLYLTYCSFGGASWIHARSMDQLKATGGVLYFNDHSLNNAEQLIKQILTALIIQKERAFDANAGPNTPAPANVLYTVDQMYNVEFSQEQSNLPSMQNSAYMGVGSMMGEGQINPVSPKYTVSFPTYTQRKSFDINMWGFISVNAADQSNPSATNSEELDYNSLGTITLDCPNGLQTQICIKRKQALDELIKNLEGPANDIVLAAEKNKSLEAYKTRHKIDLAMTQYILFNRTQMPAALEADKSSYSKNLTEYTEGAKQLGWASAGWWYWTSLRLNQRANDIINSGPVIEQNVDLESLADSYEGTETYTNLMYLMNKSLSATDKSEKITNVDNPPNATGDELSPEQLADLSFNMAQPDGLWGYVSKLVGRNSMMSIIFDPIEALAGGEEPILYLQNKGHLIVNTVVTIYTAKIMAEAMLGDEKGMGSAGSGVTSWVSAIPFVGPLLGIAAKMFMAALKLITPLLIPLLFVGLTWAYYLPIVPFLFFTMALIGTFIQFAEAMVAAPIWAAAHALPEGEGFAGAHGRQGYFLFLNILLRPPLIMVGFLLSIIMFNGIGKFIATGFMIYTGGMQAGFMNGPITFIMLSVMFTIILLVATHKLFSMVTWLPDNVIRWIGQQVQNLGENESESKTQMIFAGAMSNSKNAAQGGLGGGNKQDGGGGGNVTKAVEGLTGGKGNDTVAT